jgi:hypothetical protein
MAFNLLTTFYEYRKIEDAWGYDKKDSLESRSHGDTRYLQELTDILFRPFAQMNREVPFFETWNLLTKYTSMDHLMFKWDLERHQIDKGIGLIQEYFKNVDMELYNKLLDMELDVLPMFEGGTYNDQEHDLLVAHVVRLVSHLLYAINNLNPGDEFKDIFSNPVLKEHHEDLLCHITKIKSMSPEDEIMDDN